jgi:hypothetical protein
MEGHYDHWNRLALLLITRPEEGFEDLYKKIVRREVERLQELPEKRKAESTNPAGSMQTPAAKEVLH